MGRLTRILATAFVTVALTACGSSDKTVTTDGGLTGVTTPGDNAALLGTYVSTADVQEGKGVVGFSSPVVVKIGEDQISWYASCNTYAAQLSIEGDQLVIEGDSESTAVGCSTRSDEQDDDLIAFFESNPAWHLDGNRLTLSNDDVTVALQRDAHPADYIKQQGS